MKVYTKQDLQDKTVFNKNIASRKLIMSYNVQKDSIKLLSSKELSVLMLLLNSPFDEHFKCRDRIAKELSLSVSTVARALSSLKQKMIIVELGHTSKMIKKYTINHDVIREMYSSANTMVKKESVKVVEQESTAVTAAKTVTTSTASSANETIDISLCEEVSLLTH